jgi:hypothetical protein
VIKQVLTHLCVIKQVLTDLVMIRLVITLRAGRCAGPLRPLDPQWPGHGPDGPPGECSREPAGQMCPYGPIYP